MPEPGHAIDARVAALVAVAEGDLPMLVPTLRELAAGSVLPGLQVCLMTHDAALEDGLRELASTLEARHAWSVDVVARASGYLGMLRLAVERFAYRDIVTVSAGARLPYAWDARLAKSTYGAATIAAAVPLCDVSPVHALVDEDKRATEPDFALIDRTAYCMGHRNFYEVPQLHAVCAYLRRDALTAVLPALGGAAAEPYAVLDQLARRWRARGWSCVICDYLYVGYEGRSQPVPAGGADLELGAFLQNHPMGGLRRAVNQGIAKGLPPVSTPALDARPVQLHIMHYWGGGLDKWVRDFGKGDSGRTNMILATYRIGEKGGQRAVLYSDPAALIPIRTWDVARPITATAASSLEYQRILEEVLRDFDVEAIIVSSLIGHSLEALMQPVKTIVVCHDFYPICQAINPLFGKTCVRCTLEDLGRCARDNPLNETFAGHDAGDWHELRMRYAETLLSRRIEMIVPSPSVATTLRLLEPRLKDAPMRVIAHGVDAPASRLAPPAVKPGEPLRLVVLGRLPVPKGSALLRQAAAELDSLARVTLVGCGKPGMDLAKECRWDAIESYLPEELPDILRALDPHAGILASIVPETFSYTLSELFALGIPPLATRLGSFADRITDGENGFLFDPQPDALVTLVRELLMRPQRLEAVARNLAAAAPPASIAQMVSQYHEVLPMSPRAIARFRVGVGSQTALTEPYRHLQEAYGELQQAYDQVRAAYRHTDDAYKSTREAYENARKELESGSFKRWWRALISSKLDS
jgi:glycosyltransferase involved in cell wall biosynthesis